MKDAIYHLQISALVLEIFKFEKCVNIQNNEITGVKIWNKIPNKSRTLSNNTFQKQMKTFLISDPP